MVGFEPLHLGAQRIHGQDPIHRTQGLGFCPSGSLIAIASRRQTLHHPAIKPLGSGQTDRPWFLGGTGCRGQTDFDLDPGQRLIRLVGHPANEGDRFSSKNDLFPGMDIQPRFQNRPGQPVDDPAPPTRNGIPFGSRDTPGEIPFPDPSRGQQQKPSLIDAGPGKHRNLDIPHHDHQGFGVGPESAGVGGQGKRRQRGPGFQTRRSRYQGIEQGVTPPLGGQPNRSFVEASDDPGLNGKL